MRLARRAQADRPSIHGDDALGWALARAGRCGEATPWLDRSLRLGTKDALLFFHRGYAAGCAGDREAMRGWYRKALALDPSFSIRWAPVAARALGRTDPRGERRSRMKRLAVVLAVAVTALVATGVAVAHPLGNFTTNHYAEVVLSGDRAYVHYVLDLAEIPTFQARGDVAALGRERYADRLAKAVASGLAVSVDGRTRRLVAVERRLAFPPGAAGLRTTRFELVLAAGDVHRGMSTPSRCATASTGTARLARARDPRRRRRGDRERDRAEPRDQRALRSYPQDDSRAHWTCGPPKRGSHRATTWWCRRSNPPRRRLPPGPQPPPRVALPASSSNRS